MVAFDLLLTVQIDGISRKEVLFRMGPDGPRHLYILSQMGVAYTGIVIYIGPRYTRGGFRAYDKLFSRYSSVSKTTMLRLRTRKWLRSIRGLGVLFVKSIRKGNHHE